MATTTSRFVEKVGLGNIITWALVVVLWAATVIAHLGNEAAHLGPDEIYWLEKIKREDGFTWKPDEKSYFLQEFRALQQRFDNGIAEGRWESAAAKEARIRQVFDQEFDRRVRLIVDEIMSERDR